MWPLSSQAGEFLARHWLISAVRLCWSRLWKHTVRSAHCQPFFTTWCFLPKPSSTVEEWTVTGLPKETGTNAFFHIKFAIYKQNQGSGEWGLLWFPFSVHCGLLIHSYLGQSPCPIQGPGQLYSLDLSRVRKPRWAGSRLDSCGQMWFKGADRVSLPHRTKKSLQGNFELERDTVGRVCFYWSHPRNPARVCVERWPCTQAQVQNLNLEACVVWLSLWEEVVQFRKTWS